MDLPISEPLAFNKSKKLIQAWVCAHALGGQECWILGSWVTCGCEPHAMTVRMNISLLQELSRDSSPSLSPFYVGYGNLISGPGAYP